MKQLSDDEMVAALREADVPEPSPLFWDHLSQRVREAIAEEPQPAPTWSRRFGFAWGAGVIGTLAVAVLAVMVTTRSIAPVATPATESAMSAVAGAADGSSLQPRLEDDASWAVMGELASEMDWDEAGAAGLVAMPGAAEGALGQLSQDEQQAVVELLQQEIRNSRSL